MWLREQLPIEVSRVANVPIGGQFWDDVADIPMDISGYSFSCLVANADGEAIILSVPVTVSSSIGGMIDFSIDGKLLSSNVGKQETVTLSYQVKATDNFGNDVIALRGPLILTPGI